MATVEDLRELAMALPEVTEKTAWGNQTWRVAGKMFVWDRPLGKKDRADLGDEVPDGPTMALYAEDDGEKAALIASDPDVFLTIPHFDRGSMLLARLDAVDRVRLNEIVTDAWLARAPEKLAREFLGE